jgi:uncharacterized protein YprB with RNaseH-like and TPR domain
MDPLFERLKALGLVQADKIPAKQKVKSEKTFDEIIDGEEISNSLGTCFLTKTVYPWNYRHGNVIFEKKEDFSLVADAGKARDIREKELSSLLFIDTETTGLAGGTGTLAFLVGLGYFDDSGFNLWQYVIRDPTEEPAMLLEIANFSENFSGFVSFNGKAFDLPLLRARYVMNRLPVPFGEMAHLDLLFLARKLWKNRLKSRALQDLEQEILHIPRTQEEVPGWMIPEIYFDFLRTGNAEPLKGVIYHNGMDIVSLAALFLYISNSFDQITVSESIHPVDYFSIGQLFLDLEIIDVAEKIFIECIEKESLPVEMHLQSLKYLGSLHKKRNNYESAVVFWQKAALLEDIDSAIEMAKYYEHTARDHTKALEWTENADANLHKRGYHNYQDRQLKKDIQKRKERILRNFEKENKNVPTKNS